MKPEIYTFQWTEKQKNIHFPHILAIIGKMKFYCKSVFPLGLNSNRVVEC